MPAGRFPHSDLRPTYPFTAIVRQEEMKLALILSVIDPNIGGVLVMGHRGTGKSTAVRALADLLPRVAMVKGCAFGCDPGHPSEACSACGARMNGGRLPAERRPLPVVDLPLGATEDRVCGTLDIGRALTTGAKAFEPGLLARANRGFLYIDEVNLLPDHLADLLLDVAASGCNFVEREGISFSHPARFVLVGSGNPEEGDLRPQLVDRFGLCARVTTVTDVPSRMEIVRRRERFERDPLAFRAEAEPEQARLRRAILRGRRAVKTVAMDPFLLARVAELCITLNVNGHRGELAILRAAKALAAFEGRLAASSADVRRVAVLSLWHRVEQRTVGVDPAVRIERAMGEIFAGPEVMHRTA